MSWLALQWMQKSPLTSLSLKCFCWETIVMSLTFYILQQSKVLNASSFYLNRFYTCCPRQLSDLKHSRFPLPVLLSPPSRFLVLGRDQYFIIGYLMRNWKPSWFFLLVWKLMEFFLSPKGMPSSVHKTFSHFWYKALHLYKYSKWCRVLYIKI